MWIFTNRGMLSCVQHRDHPNVLLVRSRDRETLDELFPDYEPIENLAADYRWRVIVPKHKVAQVVCQAINDIDYPNFKDSVRDDDLHNAYMGCWSVMHRYQTRVSNGHLPDPQMDMLEGDEPIDFSTIRNTYGPGWPISGRAVHDLASDEPDDREDYRLPHWAG